MRRVSRVSQEKLVFDQEKLGFDQEKLVFKTVFGYQYRYAAKSAERDHLYRNITYAQAGHTGVPRP